MTLMGANEIRDISVLDEDKHIIIRAFEVGLRLQHGHRITLVTLPNVR